MAGLTIDNPVTLSQVCENVERNIIAGDILYLADGVYSGDYVLPNSITGIFGNPVIIKPRNPGKVVIDGSLKIDGEYVEVYDINFTDSRIDRHLSSQGVYCAQLGFGLFGCIVANQHNSGLSWYGSGIGNVCENLFLLNGLRYEDNSGHGHSIYTHNNGGGLRTIARNAFYDNLGNYTIQIYSGGANYLKDYNVQNNTIFGDPVTTGGGLGLIGFLYENNIQFQDYCQQGRYSGDHVNQNGIIRNNTFIDLFNYSVNANCTYDWENLTEENNIVYGGEPADRIGYAVTAKPDTRTWFTPFTKSARWVGMITVYNYIEAETVAIDLTGLIEAGSYVLRNTQNPSETWAFENVTRSINIPTFGWTAQAFIGDHENTCTFPTFGCFVVEKA